MTRSHRGAAGRPRLALACQLALAAALILSILAPQLASRAPAASASTAALPSIGPVTILTPGVARYDRFEAEFDVTTQATQLDLPYDPATPPGLAPSTGVSVDALFSADQWATTLVQPAYLHQAYSYTARDGRDHMLPQGKPRWRVRFTPQQSGRWELRLRVRDAGGETLSAPLAFDVRATTAHPYRRAGFLRVSQRDQRYFEFQDGSPFFGVGYNGSFETVADATQKLGQYEQHKMNFLRVWMSGSGINGSQWTSWASHHLPGDGYLPGVAFDTQNTYNGADVALRLDTANPCLYTDFWQKGVPVQPSTTYHVTARVRVDGVTGPAASGAYGFVIKQAGWLGTSCAQVNGTPITTALAGTTGWTTVSGDYTTGSGQYWLDNFYLALQNATGGRVFVDQVRVYRKDDPAQVNLLREPNANSHLSFDPLNAGRWDRYLELAEQHGVYLKLVVDEKNEWIRNHLAASGAMVAEGSNANFYAAPGTKGRWLQQAWWRYLIARWGYSTAIHSFEYVNEGDPYSGNHHEAANAFARYVHQNDPARHMVSTSFWTSFPNMEFWSNPAYQEADYADLHAYSSTGWGANASFLDQARVETRPEHIHAGNASARIVATSGFDQAINPRGLVIRGQGEWIVRYWMKAQSFSASCSFGTSGGMQRVRWLLDGGPYWGGRENVVPAQAEGKTYLCASPGGTYGWTQMRSDRDASGALIPTQHRLILADDQPHEIQLRLENSNGTAGEAWIDSVELVSPAGKVLPVIGQFDLTSLDDDTAWSNYAYGSVHGAASPAGLRKPLVRGETGVDINGEYNRDLNLDTRGIWLHHNLWSQLSAAGMYDLFWWASETIDANASTGRTTDLYDHYLAVRNFMQDIPLSNGRYRELGARTSHPDLRAWGQRDDAGGRMHLWVQNRQHTWRRAVSGPAVTAIAGSVTIPDVAAGSYTVSWWNTYRVDAPVFQTQTITLAARGDLVLNLPAALADDVAVKIVSASAPQPTPSATAGQVTVPSATATRTATPAAATSQPPTATRTATRPAATSTATKTATRAATSSIATTTKTATRRPTKTATRRPTKTATRRPTRTPTATLRPTRTPTVAGVIQVTPQLPSATRTSTPLPPSATRTSTPRPSATRTSTQAVAPSATRTPSVPGAPSPTPGGAAVTEWTQDGHDAQRTGYTPEEPAGPWTLAWTWNGPDANGGTGGHFYTAPREARTITGGAHVYVPAGAQGLYALSKQTGQPVWNLRATSFNATPAYDPASGFLFAGGANGTLYKLNAATGAVAGTYLAGGPLNKSVLLVGGAVYVVTDGGELHKVDGASMTRAWVYAAGSGVATPPAYAASRDAIVFCSDDLYVHAVQAGDGARKWRVKPSPNAAGFPNEFEGQWPVVAEQHGIVFVRMRLAHDALWSGPGAGNMYPNTNAETRAHLQSKPQLKNLFALSLDTGAEAFVPAVGYGGVEDLVNGTPYLNTGPVPVVKVQPDGKEVAYQMFRNGQSAPPDGRWDSHVGEMVLDGQTVSGLAAGDLRFVQWLKPYVITDEQTPLTMAGSTLFHAHWGASESVTILDRSAARGLSYANPITTRANASVIRRQQACSSFAPATHWTTCGLTLYGDGRYWNGPGWWVYWNTLDPPTPGGTAYSDGLRPRYTYVSAGLIIVEGNGGELFVLRHA